MNYFLKIPNSNEYIGFAVIDSDLSILNFESESKFEKVKILISL